MTTAEEIKLQTVLDHFQDVLTTDDGWKARCPCHEDQDQSLSLTIGRRGQLLVHDFGGCSTRDVLKKVGLYSYHGSEFQLLDLGLPPRECNPSRCYEVIDSSLRREVNQDLVLALGLSSSDATALMKRGFSMDTIKDNEYRSLTFWLAVAASKSLYGKYGDSLLTVPGFVPDVTMGVSLVIQDGLLIPVREPGGKIEAFQVRRDMPGPRYSWFNSRSGTPLKITAHVPLLSSSFHSTFITEGPLKADFVRATIGLSVIGVPGVSSWRTALEVIGTKPHQFVLAFDQDWTDKQGVRQAITDLAVTLTQRGHYVTMATWDSDWKGIDEAINDHQEITYVPGLVDILKLLGRY